MSFIPHADAPMSKSELSHADLMRRCGEISASDLAWLLGMEDEAEDKPPPRGFKSWYQFNAFLYHKERKARGLPKLKRKKARQ